MNRLTQFFVFLLAIGCSILQAQSTDKKPALKSAESEVQMASDIYYRAFYTGDVDTVKRMTRDDYLQTDVFGNVQDKSHWLAEYYLPLAERIRTGGLKLDIVKSTDVRIRRYRNVAVITGRTTLKNSAVSGEAQPRDIRFTQVWVKINGQWQRGVYHNAFVPEPNQDTQAKD